MTSLAAVLLNAYFNRTTAAEAEEDAVVVVAVAEDSVVEGVEDLPSKARRLHSKLLLVR